jgi:Uma2 family endonuclease
MAKTGILGEDERIELIDGEILVMAPIGEKHVGCVRRCIRTFTSRIGTAAIIDVQDPLQLAGRGEPQPDVTLLRPDAEMLGNVIPTAGDVLLLVEVADTTLQYDRQVKAPLYAQSGIPELWIADLEHDLIEVHRDPTSDGYRTIRIARRGEQIAPVAFPDRPIAVADILG